MNLKIDSAATSRRKSNPAALRNGENSEKWVYRCTTTGQGAMTEATVIIWLFDNMDEIIAQHEEEVCR